MIKIIESQIFQNQNLPNTRKHSFFSQSKFISLSLAFKTDKLTLANRLELQQRQRDTAERNIENEIEALKNAVGVREVFWNLVMILV